MEHYAKIKVLDPEGALIGFPMLDDQYIDEENYRDDGTGTVTVYLAHQSDLTAAQEQALDTNPKVASYKVVARKS